MPASKSDLASRASMATGLSCLAAASTFGIEPPQLADRRLILLDGGVLDWVSPGTAFHLSAWFWNNMRSPAWS